MPTVQGKRSKAGQEKRRVKRGKITESRHAQPLQRTQEVVKHGSLLLRSDAETKDCELMRVKKILRLCVTDRGISSRGKNGPQRSLAVTDVSFCSRFLRDGANDVFGESRFSPGMARRRRCCEQCEPWSSDRNIRNMCIQCGQNRLKRTDLTLFIARDTDEIWT